MKKEIVELRTKMEENGIDVYFVPSGDYHSSEYVNDYFKCREFMTGLTGESGELVVTMEGAYLWTDGRYFLQAESQLAGTEIELMRMAEPGVPTVEEFLDDLAEKMNGYVLGFDGKMINTARGVSLRDDLGKRGVSIVWDKDLVDEVWTDRPELNPTEIFQLPLKTVGYSAAEKVAAVRREMTQKGADYLLVSDLMEVAWLFNLRANDVEYIPVLFSYAIVGMEDVRLFTMTEVGEDILNDRLDFVTPDKYENIEEAVAELPVGRTLWYDGGTTNYALALNIPQEIDRIDESTPIEMMKAIKNIREIKSTFRAHIKDGLAMVKFIKWIKDVVKEKSITELDAVEYLYNCRKEQGDFLELSFETIVGYGPNGAIIHYAPTPETDAEMKPEGLVLVDSGGQYMQGTTDLTRTIALGDLTQEMIDGYTYVLKSHIAMMRAVLSPDKTGMDLDALTRAPMREVGLDFKHGLGHGVGHLLACHEGPNILRRVPTPCKLIPGMIMSDEPGLYIDHKFGVRIENEVIIKSDKDGNNTFHSITYCPYERRAINLDLLTDEEIEWVDNYHQMVRGLLMPMLDSELGSFLMEQTEPLR